MPSSLASFFAPADSNEPPAHRNSLSKGEVAADGDLDSRLANILGSSGTSGKFSKFIIFTLSEFEILQSFFIIKILLKNKIIKNNLRYWPRNLELQFSKESYFH